MELLETTNGDHEADFWTAFENSAAGVAVVDLDGRILRANAELCKFLGYSEEELQLVTFKDITHPDDLEGDVALFEKALSGEISSYRVEKRYVRGDGKAVWALLSTALSHNPEGEPLRFVAVVQDTTERRTLQDELARARDRYLAICENVSDFISVHDLDWNYRFASPACTRLLGFEPEELVGTNAFNYFHPDDLKIIMESHRTLDGDDECSRVRYRIRRKKGDYIWFETYSQPIESVHGGQKEILCVSRDVRDYEDMYASILEERKKSEEHSRVMGALALRDELTSLMNRRAIDDLLKSRLASRRAANFPFGCLMVDIDNFGQVNDTFGRTIGDSVLNRLGQVLVERCRTEDYVGRYAGDRYVIVLPATDPGGTVLVGERIIQSVAAAWWPELPPDYGITVSIGGTCLTRPSTMDLDELLELIDSQLARAKEMGRNRLVMDARQAALRPTY